MDQLPLAERLADHRRRFVLAVAGRPAPQSRLAESPLDARAVLYGQPLLQFVAAQCLSALADQPLREVLPAAEDSEPVSPLDDTRDDDERDVIRQVHVLWMLTPRDDLRGQTPRHVLISRRNFIDLDLQDRADQWSRHGVCPPGLEPDAFAYRCGGCGTHENVAYYYLVRHLLWTCRDRLAELKAAGRLEHLTAGDFLAGEVPRLARARQRWLDMPDPECHGRTVGSIIDRERRRIPEAVSAEDAMVDHDCPLCQMMAESLGSGPVFWHLDGCNMDEDFAFSWHDTRQEWEAEQQQYEEFSRLYHERRAERERLGVEDPCPGYLDPDHVWQRSFVADWADDGPSIPLRLFAIGSNLAELTVDLKSPVLQRSLVDPLHRDFGNLREVCRADDPATFEALVQPVLDRLCDSLANVAAQRNDLRRKCEDLQQRLQCFLDPPRPCDESVNGLDEEVPF